MLGAAAGTLNNSSLSNPLLVCITLIAKYVDYCFGKVKGTSNDIIVQGKIIKRLLSL